eukprot:tig00021348_g20556.t1
MIHYSQSTWLDTLWIFARWKGSVYRIIMYQTMAAAAWGAIVSWIPRDPSVKEGIGIPTTMHSFSAVALGFLLVYRARIAYERFWDGRTGYAHLVSLTRDLATQLISFVDPSLPDAPRARANAVRLAAAYLTAATIHVHSGGECDDLSLIEKWLTPAEMECFKAYPGSKPVLVSGWLRAEIHSLHKQGYIQNAHLRNIDPMISNLLTRFGTLDAICDTPVPFPYVQMLQVSLFIYFVALPFVFLPILGSDAKRKWQIPFIMAVFSFVFYGLKSIATELEDPFGDDDNDLPLEDMLASVDVDVRACLADPCPLGSSLAERCATAAGKMPPSRPGTTQSAPAGPRAASKEGAVLPKSSSASSHGSDRHAARRPHHANGRAAAAALAEEGVMTAESVKSTVSLAALAGAPRARAAAPRRAGAPSVLSPTAAAAPAAAPAAAAAEIAGAAEGDGTRGEETPGGPDAAAAAVPAVVMLPPPLGRRVPSLPAIRIPPIGDQ